MSGADDILGRLLNEAIKPHAERIAELAERRRFVAVVFEPHEDAVKFARALGWDRSTPIFGLRETRVRRLAEIDHACERWFATKPCIDHIKAFVIMHRGTLLLNFEPDRGWYIEPGSTDASIIN